MSPTTPTGWNLCAMHDPAGRRGLWYRETRDAAGRLTSVELCAGREGGDAFARLEVGPGLTSEQLYDLTECLSWAACMADSNAPRNIPAPTPSPQLVAAALGKEPRG